MIHLCLLFWRDWRNVEKTAIETEKPLKKYLRRLSGFSGCYDHSCFYQSYDTPVNVDTECVYNAMARLSKPSYKEDRNAALKYLYRFEYKTVYTIGQYKVMICSAKPCVFNVNLDLIGVGVAVETHENMFGHIFKDFWTVDRVSLKTAVEVAVEKAEERAGISVAIQERINDIVADMKIRRAAIEEVREFLGNSTANMLIESE